MKTITNIIYLAFALFALACFAFSSQIKADCPSTCPGGGNTGTGDGALDSVTTGINNTAVGKDALTNTTDGAYNVAIGRSTLQSNVSGNFNMAIGTEALRDSTANYNLAIGFRVGFVNTTGRHLTGIGAGALLSNTTGSFNTAIGSDALSANTIGEDNTAVGSEALVDNLTGGENVAIGFGAAASNNSGAANTAVGSLALNTNTTGTEDTAVGRRALQNLNGGHENTAIGWGAGAAYTGTEFNNICIGDQTVGVTGESNAIRIGTHSTSGGINVVNNGPAANGITIGAGLTGGGIQYLHTILGQTVSVAPNFSTVTGASHCFVGGIYNQTPTAGSHAVLVGPDNKLADATLSSRRFKKDIAPMDKASERLLALKPVTFHWKNDKTNEPEFGLIAEEVAKVNPDWITRDPQGEIIGVRYETIPVLLLNEFLKEHGKVEKLEAMVAGLAATVKEQAAQIQKVSAQLELNKPAPQTVLNNR